MSAEAAVLDTRSETRSETWWVYAAIPMLAAAIAFTWFIYTDLQRIYGLTTDAANLATYQHAVWTITQGDWHHLELILFPIAAIELLWPSPILLAILAAAALAATAPTAYLFFRAILPEEQKASAWLAIALATPIPFWAATQQAASDLFHPNSLALPLALVAASAAIKGRGGLMWSFVALTLACSPDQAYTVAVLSLLARQHAPPGIKEHWRLVFYLAFFWFVMGAVITRPHPNPTLPAVVIAAGILASMAGLPLLAPGWLLLAVPPFLATAFDPSYVLLLMFPLIVAGGIGARRLIPRLRPAIAIVLALPALIIGWGTGQLPPAALTPSSAYGAPNAVAQLQTAAAVIPKDAPVNADAPLEVWLANRRAVEVFPNKLDPGDYVVIDVRSSINDSKRQTALDALPASGRRLLYDDGRFEVWSPVGDY